MPVACPSLKNWRYSFVELRAFVSHHFFRQLVLMEYGSRGGGVGGAAAGGSGGRDGGDEAAADLEERAYQQRMQRLAALGGACCGAATCELIVVLVGRGRSVASSHGWIFAERRNAASAGRLRGWCRHGRYRQSSLARIADACALRAGPIPGLQGKRLAEQRHNAKVASLERQVGTQ